MTTKSTFKFTSTAIAAAFLVAAGGGGGGSGTSAAAPASPASTPSVPANLTTPQYAADSVQLAAFNLLNQQRQQCGFPALQENTIHDQAAQAHADYMRGNGGTVTDTEVSSNAEFTGVSYSDRAVHFGYPQGISNGGVSGAFFTNATFSNTQYGQQLVYGWLSGVYHVGVAFAPLTTIGVGVSQTTFAGFPEIFATLSLANLQTMTANSPLTFPCQGVTGIAFKGTAESPTPPNTSGSWGTPIVVVGNPGDAIALQSGTATDTSGNVIALQVLNAGTDPNKEIPTYEAVAYPSAPLTPNSAYAVSLTGTVNGKAFSRNFTFTTGNVVG
jgi:uncharacterized protein YkwD